jgi:hypothetical protein
MLGFKNKTSETADAEKDAAKKIQSRKDQDLLSF